MDEYSSLQELSLKAIFSISKQGKCLLHDFCYDNWIDCEGERHPFCILETKLHKNEISNELKEKLLNENIIKILLSLQSKLLIDDIQYPKVKMIESVENFICPYFRKSVKDCSLKICQYNSPVIIGTSCILSMKPRLKSRIPISHIMITKDIPKKRLLKLIFGITVGKKWDALEILIKENINKVETCKNCGYIKEECIKNEKECSKRKKLLQCIENECMIPDHLLKYPMIIVLISSYKFFGEFFNFLFSKKIINHYLKGD